MSRSVARMIISKSARHVLGKIRNIVMAPVEAAGAESGTMSGGAAPEQVLNMQAQTSEQRSEIKRRVKENGFKKRVAGLNRGGKVRRK